VVDLSRGKVCIIAQRFFSPPTYDPYLIREKAQILSEKGYTVNIISTQKGKNSRNEEPSKHGKVIRIPTGGFYGIAIPILDNPLQMLVLLSEALKVNAGIYHVHGLANILVGTFLGIIGKKVIYDISDDHPSHNNYPNLIKTLIRCLEGVFLGFYDVVITSTERLRLDRLRFHPKIEVIPYCPPPYYSFNSIERGKEEKTIVYAGEINRKKGIDKILESLEIVTRKFKNIKLILIGNISGKEEEILIRKAIAEKNLKKYTEMIGWLSIEQLYSVFRQSDIALCTLKPWCYSYVISIPWKLMDYMACGVPVIASKGLIEVEKIVKSSQCGILVNPEDAKEIANAMIHLIENDELRAKMARNAEDLIKNNYKWDSFRNGVSEVYASLS